MIKVNDNIVNLLQKVRRAVKSGQITAEGFPMGEIMNLIQDTMGNSFWDCIGSKGNPGFLKMAQIYGECLQDAVARKDMDGCGRILHLFESSYLAFYGAMEEDERVFRQRPYRKMIMELGMGSAQVQARLHRQRQCAVNREKEALLSRGKGAVYTCLLGEGEPEQPREVSAELEYICFTDQEDRIGEMTGVWKYCPIDNQEQWSRRALKFRYMIMAHKVLAEYDYSIWLDPTMRIVGDLLHFARIYGDGNSFLGFLQGREDCLYHDISLTDMVDDDINIAIRKKTLQYQKEGYPKYNGLLDGRVMVRNHRNEELWSVMETWWCECRDSGWFCEGIFNYAAWKLEYPFSVCDLFLDDNPYFKSNEIELDMNDDY